MSELAAFSRVVTMLGLMSLGPWRAALAQSPTPSACTALANATRDSVPLVVVLQVHAFSPKQALPATYQLDFGDAVKRHFVVPRPLGADLYNISEDQSGTAHLVVHGNYSATITADGRVINPLTTGGDRNRAFDEAVLAALRAVDSTDLLSMALGGLPNDDVAIRIAISTQVNHSPVRVLTAGRSESINTILPSQGLARDSQPAVPLFAFRAPVRRVTQPLTQTPGTGGLNYPDKLRQANIEGEVRTSYVVGADGVPEAGSLQASFATHVGFVQAVLDALPTLAFSPLHVEGCAVRSLVAQPFTFSIRR